MITDLDHDELGNRIKTDGIEELPQRIEFDCGKCGNT